MNDQWTTLPDISKGLKISPSYLRGILALVGGLQPRGHLASKHQGPGKAAYSIPEVSAWAKNTLLPERVPDDFEERLRTLARAREVTA